MPPLHRRGPPRSLVRILGAKAIRRPAYATTSSGAGQVYGPQHPRWVTSHCLHPSLPSSQRGVVRVNDTASPTSPVNCRAPRSGQAFAQPCECAAATSMVAAVTVISPRCDGLHRPADALTVWGGDRFAALSPRTGGLALPSPVEAVAPARRQAGRLNNAARRRQRNHGATRIEG